MIWFWWLSLAQADCPSVHGAELDAAGALALLQLNEAELALDRLRDGMACAPLLSPQQVGHYFQLQGALLDLREEVPAAESAFAAARRVAPDAWNPDLGEGRARRLFESALPVEGEPVEVVLDNLENGEWVAFDGAPSTEPYRLAPGLHVVQVGVSGGAARFAREFEAPAGQRVQIHLPAASAPTSEWRSSVVTLTTPLTPRQRRTRRTVSALVAGGAGALLYGAALGARQFYDDDPTDGWRTTVNTLYIGSATAGAAGVGLFAVAMATPAR